MVQEFEAGQDPPRPAGIVCRKGDATYTLCVVSAATILLLTWPLYPQASSEAVLGTKLFSIWDFANNLLLFVPLAMSMWWYCQTRGWSAWGSSGLTALGCCGGSLTAELLQACLPWRTSSLYDVIANAAGAAVVSASCGVLPGLASQAAVALADELVTRGRLITDGICRCYSAFNDTVGSMSSGRWTASYTIESPFMLMAAAIAIAGGVSLHGDFPRLAAIGLDWDYRASGNYPEWVFWAWPLAVAGASLAALKPLAGCVCYLFVAYSTQGSEIAARAVVVDGPQHWACTLLLAGTWVWAYKRKALTATLVRSAPIGIPLILMLLWVGLCWSFTPLHQQPLWYREPSLWLHCVAVYLAVVASCRTQADVAVFVYAIACIVLWRLHGTRHSAWLEGHIASYFALIIPLVLASIRRENALSVWEKGSSIALAVMVAWMLSTAGEDPTRGVVIAGPAYERVLLVMLFGVAWLSSIRTVYETRILVVMIALYLAYRVLVIQNRAAVVALLVSLALGSLLAGWKGRLGGAAVGVFAAAWAATSANGVALIERFNDTVNDSGALTGSAAERVEVWRAGWRMYLDRPLFGVGPGQFSNRVHEYSESLPVSRGLDAHNSVVQMLGETGAVGAGLYVGVFVTAIVLTLSRILISEGKATNWVGKGLLTSMAAYVVVGLAGSRNDTVLIYAALGLVGVPLSSLRCGTLGGRFDFRPRSVCIASVSVFCVTASAVAVGLLWLPAAWRADVEPSSDRATPIDGDPCLAGRSGESPGVSSGAVWGATGLDEESKVWVGVSQHEAGAGSSARLYLFDPSAGVLIDRGDVLGQLSRLGLLRSGESQNKIHSKIVQGADGDYYFSSMDEVGEKADGSQLPKWGSHLWRLPASGGGWEHLAAAREGLIAVATANNYLYALGYFNHVVYQLHLPSGKIRKRVVGSLGGHVSRNFLCDHRGHCYVPRVVGADAGDGSTASLLVELDTRLDTVAETPLEAYRGGQWTDHGIVSWQPMNDGVLYFNTAQGMLYRVAPSQDNSPAVVTKLGWFNPNGPSYAATLFTDAGQQSLVGVTKRDNRYEWVRYSIRDEDWDFEVIPRDHPFYAADLLYGCQVRDAEGRFYVVGRRKIASIRFDGSLQRMALAAGVDTDRLRRAIESYNQTWAPAVFQVEASADLRRIVDVKSVE